MNSEKSILNIIKYGPFIWTLMFSLIVTFIIIEEQNYILKKEINIFKDEFLEKSKTEIKNEVDRVINFINYEIKNSNKLSDLEIQEYLLNKIKEIKFDNMGYIFIFDNKGTYLSHFDENKIGTNGFNVKDVNGKYFVKDMFESIKNYKEGYIKYLASSKPNSNITNVEKISYVKYFEKWQWIIGAGFYEDELNEKIIKKEIELKDNYKMIINSILILSTLLTLVLIIISFYISKKISKVFTRYKKELEKEINKTIEKERLLNQQSKMAIMGEMIGNIAHQWKQPLSTISVVSSGIKLQKELNCLNDGDIIIGMNQISDSVQYLSQTIDDFRNFFKPDKTKTTFTVLQVFKETIKLIKPQFINNNIELIKNIDDRELYGYHNELLQVLINIFKNARDELVKLDSNKKRFIFINTYKDNSNYIIKIKDNAGGIPNDIIEKIFEPYFTTKDEDEGTGIGLYMSKQIINGMNGKIEAKNIKYEYEKQEYFGAEFEISIQL